VRRRVGVAASVVVSVLVSVVVSVGVAGSRVDAEPVEATTAVASVQLPAPAVVGQQADVRARVAHTTAAGSFELVVSLSTAVTVVNTDGSYTTRSTISMLDVPVGAEIAGNGVNNLVNQSFEQTFTAGGAAIPQDSTLINATSMSAEQQASGRALVNALSMVSIGFPPEPVAVGTSWTVDGAVGSQGITIPVTYYCSLTALTDSTYTMAVSYTRPFSHSANAGVIEATIAGSGTIVGSLTNPLVVSAALYQTIDGIEGSAPLHIDTSIALDGTAG
jgi:hypothetical protein